MLDKFLYGKEYWEPLFFITNVWDQGSSGGQTLHSFIIVSCTSVVYFLWRRQELFIRLESEQRKKLNELNENKDSSDVENSLGSTALLRAHFSSRETKEFYFFNFSEAVKATLYAR